jgi:L-ribulose-5-phosphate 4-epimerase
MESSVYLEEQRQLIVEFGLQMLNDKLAHDGQGNISVYDRESGLIAITPSAIPYLDRKAEDICVVDIDGKVVEGHWKPTSEHALHYVFYRNRNDVNAVVHTHALNSTVFGIIGEEFLPVVLNEAAMGMGGPIPVAPYARPGTEELGEITCQAAGAGVGAIMAHHGLVTVGDTLAHAYMSTQAIETTAKTIILARSMGAEVVTLDPDEARALRDMFLYSYAATRLDG